MYNPQSTIATEFIDDQEIRDSLAYAQENKSNYELINSLIERAADCKGLSHREAAVLLECDIPELNEKMFTLAKKIKREIYGDRIVLCPTIASMVVYTVHITDQTNISLEKNLLEKIL